VSNVKEMKQRTKSILFHSPKVIIFGLALLNFFYILSYVPTMRTSGKISFPAISYWYETSDVSNIVVILAASVFLLISKRWSYLIAISMSGYLVVYGLFDTTRIIIYFGFLKYWSLFNNTYSNIFLAEEIQWILAGIIFTCSSFYLMRDIWHKTISRKRFA
jgi:hypothetical protein